MAAYDEVLSKQYHSIRFYYGEYTTKNVPYRIGDNSTTVADETEKFYDTWKDFHLIPAERPTVALPKTNSKLISIPGRRTPIDMTEYLTGHPTYGNRTGSWMFFVDTDFVEQNGGWVAFDKNLRSKFHSKVYKIILRDDPSYFYVGELTMSPWSTGQDRSSITISYNLYPYKKATQSSLDLWKFDDFDFQDGFIQYLKDMEVTTSRIVNVYGSKERISPHIAGTGSLLIDKYENNNWVSYGSVPTPASGQTVDSLLEGQSSIIPRFIVVDGLNRIRFRGNGVVTIDYRRGLL